jgi:hypothetical protein
MSDNTAVSDQKYLAILTILWQDSYFLIKSAIRFSNDYIIYECWLLSGEYLGR